VVCYITKKLVKRGKSKMSFFNSLFGANKQTPQTTVRPPPGPSPPPNPTLPEDEEDQGQANAPGGNSRRDSTDSQSTVATGAGGKFVPPSINFGAPKSAQSSSRLPAPIAPESPMSPVSGFNPVVNVPMASPPPENLPRQSSVPVSAPAAAPAMDMFAGLTFVSPGGSAKPASSFAPVAAPAPSVGGVAPSSFGFISSNPAPAPAPAPAAAGSAFGFIGGATGGAAPVVVEQPKAAASSSAFGFIGGAAPVPVVEKPQAKVSYVIGDENGDGDDNDNDNDNDDDDQDAVPAPNAAAPSSFNFLGSSVATVLAMDDTKNDPTDSPSHSRGTSVSEAAPPTFVQPSFPFKSVERPRGESGNHVSPSQVAQKAPVPAVVASKPKPVPKDKIDELRLVFEDLDERVRALEIELEEGMKLHWARIQDFNNEQTRLKQIEHQKKEAIEKTKIDVKVDEEMQSKAIEDEEYETADQLNTKIESSRRRVSQIRGELVDIYKKIDGISAAREKRTSETVEFITDIISRARKLREGNVSLSVLSLSSIHVSAFGVLQWCGSRDAIFDSRRRCFGWVAD
jgi:hypothetical protein